MRICIPAENNNGLKSTVYGHFGSAPFFIIYNTDTNKIEVIDNSNQHHGNGQCNPLAPFVDNPIDVMITGGIGARALQKLNAGGVKAYRVTEVQNISEVIKKLENNQLAEITVNDACSHHNDCN